MTDIRRERVRVLEEYDRKFNKNEIVEYCNLVRTLKAENAYSLLPHSSMEVLKQIPINGEVMSYLDNNNNALCNTLNVFGYSYLDEIFDIDRITFLEKNTVGIEKWKNLLKMRRMLAENLDDFLYYYNTCYNVYTVTVSDEERDLPLYTRFELVFNRFCDALNEVGRFIKKVKNDSIQMINVLDNNKDSLIANLTDERLRQLREMYVYQLRRGYVDFAPNVQIDPDLMAEIHTFENSDPRYKSAAFVYEKMGGDKLDGTRLAQILYLHKTHDAENHKNPYSKFDQPYYIPKNDFVSDIQKYMSALYILFKGPGAEVRPQSMQQIIDSLEVDDDFEVNDDLVRELVEQNTMLECISENGENKYSIKYSYLTSYQKLARIIYEQKIVSIKEAREIDKAKSTDGKKISSISAIWGTTAGTYPWVSTGGQAGVYIYNDNGKVIPQMSKVIRDFTLEKKIFHFSDVVEYLKNLGCYTVVNENSLRTYILKSCQPSNSDKDLFCHSDYVGNHPEYTWRSRTENGQSNWIIKNTIGYLKGAGGYSMNLKDVVKRLKTDVKNADTQYNVQNSRTVLRMFAAESDIFALNNDTLTLTSKGLELTDVEIAKIGIRDKKPDYYREVVATIQSSLRKQASGMMLMKDVKDLCVQAIGFDLGTRFYRIVDKYLPDQIVKVHEEDKIYLKLLEDKIEYAPSMIIDVKKSDDKNIAAPTLVNRVVDSTVYGQQHHIRERFNWDDLFNMMKTELVFYTKWWIKDLTLEESIDKFIGFINHVDSRRIKNSIPQFMFEFWHCKNDEFDYFQYLQELAMCYEQLLACIDEANGNVAPKVHGLVERVAAMPEVNDWVQSRIYPHEGFLKIFRTLKYTRNTAMHGNDVDITLVRMIQDISSFIALYVYTVARFLK